MCDRMWLRPLQKVLSRPPSSLLSSHLRTTLTRKAWTFQLMLDDFIQTVLIVFWCRYPRLNFDRTQWRNNWNFHSGNNSSLLQMLLCFAAGWNSRRRWQTTAKPYLVRPCWQSRWTNTLWVHCCSTAHKSLCDILDQGLSCFPVRLRRALESNHISMMSINGKVQVLCFSFLSLLDMTHKSTGTNSYHQPASFCLLTDACVCVCWLFMCLSCLGK